MSLNKSFSEDLERLIMIFKKIRENLINDHSHNIDKAFIQNIDMMITNYETIKGKIPAEMLNTMGEPIHKLMTLLLEQLSEEYKDIIGMSRDELFGNTQERVEEPVRIPEGVNEIELIDQMLQRTDLKPSEVDNLLDRRMMLKAKSENKD